MNVYERVEKMRKERGISSQGKLEKELGFSNGSISKWKNSAPTTKRLQKLAAYFGVSVEYLLNGDESGDETSATAPASDPLRDYYDRLIRYLDSSPAHRQLLSDAAHVRIEDIDMIRPLLQRCADPDSSAPDLPDLDTVKNSGGMISDTLDTSGDTSRDFHGNFQALPGANHGQESQAAANKSFISAEKSCELANTIADAVELTDETLALVRDTPEVLRAEAEYIKKMSVKPPKRGGTASPSIGANDKKGGRLA